VSEPRSRFDGGLALSLFLVVAYVAVTIAVHPYGAPEPEPPEGAPHVVLIILDTLRADKLSSYGFRQNTSPALDALAARGARFETVETQAPWTRPSIGSMLTSLYPRTVGIYREGGDQLHDRFTTLAEALRRNGYRTIGATANPHLNRVFNFHQGFQEYFESNILWANMPGVEMPEEGHDPILWRAPDMFERIEEVLDAESPEDAARPHYIQVDLMEVHEYGAPWLLEDEYRGMYGGAPLERKYYQAIRQVTDDVGDFVASIREREGWENTVFVITSDHGEGLYDHRGLRFGNVHGFYLYESCTEVPLILHGTAPGLIPRGEVVEQRVTLLDVMPTILELAKAEVPDTLEGRSLVPLLRDGELEPPEHVFQETHFRSANKLSVTTDEWIYVENRDAMGHPERELQRRDRRSAGEATSQVEAHPDLVEELSAALHEWEQRYPSTTPTERGQDISPQELEQLRQLGYMP